MLKMFPPFFSRRVVEEILNTEETYVADLKIVVEVREIYTCGDILCRYDVICLFRNVVPGLYPISFPLA